MQNSIITLLSVTTICYLLLLFAIAYAVDHYPVRRSISRSPLIFSLSISVYATSWSYYGSVGLAAEQGYMFLTIYFGVILACAISPLLLEPIFRHVRNYQLTSLADLFSLRFQSSSIGILVTLLLLIGTLPYIALQIEAVSGSLHILHSDFARDFIALAFCVIMVLFTLLFGSRHISAKQKHDGIVVAIAFESLVKLLALLCIGIYALYFVFDGWQDLQQWLTENPHHLQQLTDSIGNDNRWPVFILLSFSAAFLLPRQFQMMFVENDNPDALVQSTWLFPLYLLLLNLPIPIILFAGWKLGLTIPADFFVLGITLHSELTYLPIIAFLGGFSAASAMIIITTLALSSMLINYIWLPSRREALFTTTNLYKQILLGKRIAMLLVILCGYLFYLLLQHHQALAGLGLLSFVAVAQCLPAIIAALYIPHITSNGVIAGITTGGLIWLVTLLLPLLYNAGILPETVSWLTYLQLSIADATIWSLSLNSIIMVSTSLLFPSTTAYKNAQQFTQIASDRTDSALLPVHSNMQQLHYELKQMLGSELTRQEIDRALHDLHFTEEPNTPKQLEQLWHQIGINLSGVIGPLLAQSITNRQLLMDNRSKLALADTIHHFEQQLTASQVQQQTLYNELATIHYLHQKVLHDLPLGAITINNHGLIVSCNPAFATMAAIEANEVLQQPLVNIPSPWSNLLNRFYQGRDNQLNKLQFQQSGDNNRILNLFKADFGSTHSDSNLQGTIIIIEDHTSISQLEQELAHSERLASIGQLATGVAHEIGNPLTAISCLAQDMQYCASDNESITLAQQIMQQTSRISAIVQALTQYSHSGNRALPQQSRVDFSAVIQEAIYLVSLSKESKRCQFHVDVNTLPMLQGDQQLLTQMMVNLLTNAVDASPQGGAITIRCHSHKSLLQIEIIDNGSGIDAEIVKKIYDPFFTTKQIGEGTGLGLSLVSNIVQKHQGTITVDSTPKQGTTFRIELPIQQQAKI